MEAQGAVEHAYLSRSRRSGCVPPSRRFPPIAGVRSTCPACRPPPPVDQAIDPANKDAAKFELRETIPVLKEMGMSTPPIDERTTVCGRSRR